MIPYVVQLMLSVILILSSIGVITARKPVYSALFFLLSLFTLATFYLLLSAEFTAALQVLVYAGAILVIFMFVIVLFQDAHAQLGKFEPQSSPTLLYGAGSVFILAMFFLWKKMVGTEHSGKELPDSFGSVQSLGELLYIEFFFPFEAVILLFLIALVGSLYIAKKAQQQGKSEVRSQNSE